MSQGFPYLSVELRVEDEPVPADVAILNDRFYRHNAAVIGWDNGRWLTIFVRDEAGDIVAGLHGWTWGQTSFVQTLWVREDLRGRGLGARLLATAEAEAARRGCREVHLDTHSWQAPDFYRQQGYEEIGELPGWPDQTTRIFLRKSLPDSPNAAAAGRPGDRVMDRRAFLGTLAGSLLAAPLAAEAQPAGKVYRIGVVARPGAPDTPHGRAFREGLRDLGWVEGQTVTIDWRWMGAESGQLDTVAAELVRAGVDVIVTGSTPATLAAKRATQTIPIVIAGMAYPVERGAVVSLARPGGNVTGVAGAVEAPSRRFQLLKEAAPRASRVAYLQDPLSDLPAEGREARRQAMAADARKLRLDVQWIDLRSPTELEAALTRLASSGVNGLIVSDTSSLYAQRERICVFASVYRLPAIGRVREFAEAGCLLSYGPNQAAMWGRAASYVDRLLRGARPADLPVEQPTKLELVINRKTAKALGLTIPPLLLQRADQVIE